MDIIYRVDPHTPLHTPQIKSADEALAKLAAGNARFHSLVCRVQDAAASHAPHPEIVIPVTPISLGVPFISGVAPSHNPYALILGCSDARMLAYRWKALWIVPRTKSSWFELPVMYWAWNASAVLITLFAI